MENVKRPIEAEDPGCRVELRLRRPGRRTLHLPTCARRLTRIARPSFNGSRCRLHPAGTPSDEASFLTGRLSRALAACVALALIVSWCGGVHAPWSCAPDAGQYGPETASFLRSAGDAWTSRMPPTRRWTRTMIPMIPDDDADDDSDDDGARTTRSRAAMPSFRRADSSRWAYDPGLAARH